MIKPVLQCEPSAIRRKKNLFRTQDLLDESLVEAKHICLKPCNLTLSCGIHKCQRKCHPGKCPPCLESDSNDLVCPCGKTVVPAPVRCGTEATNM
ncbi:BBT_HP_G0131780.mRNA.1.CDS.1 [Saccharomyces cerevisiae]|nr:BBT_HP_G0131780.mRNA.1.CDS.1 [Saccharomyces cerevisiae]CAI6975452.1 BBT_HP_G0131780.mRNA.1.CDS.1 [Saccharomyces cerevisiae]